MAGAKASSKKDGDAKSLGALKSKVLELLDGQTQAALERAGGFKKGALSRIFGGKQKLKDEHLADLAMGLNQLRGPKKDSVKKEDLQKLAPDTPPKKPSGKASKKSTAKTTAKPADKSERAKADKTEKAELKKEAAALRKEVAAHLKTIGQLNQDKEKQALVQKELKESLATTEKNEARLRQELGTMGQALESSHQEQKGLLAALQTEKERGSELEKEVAEIRGGLKESEKRLADLKKERDSAQGRIDKEKTAAHSAWKHISELEEELSEANEALKAEKSQVTRLEGELIKARAAREKLKDQVGRLTDTLKQAKTTYVALKQKNVDIRKILEAEKKARKAAVSIVTSSKKPGAESGLRQEIQSAVAEVNRYRKELADAEKKIAERSKALEAARDVINQWRTYAKQRDLRVSQLKAALKKTQVGQSSGKASS